MRISDGSDVRSYIGCEVLFNRRSDRLGRRDCADAIRCQRASNLWGIKVLHIRPNFLTHCRRGSGIDDHGVSTG